MRLSEMVDHLDLPMTNVAEGAWDKAVGRERRRRMALVATAAAIVVAIITVVGITRPGDEAKPPVITPSPSVPDPTPTGVDGVVGGAHAEAKSVVVDPSDPSRRAALWWKRVDEGDPEAALVLTEDAFATRTIRAVNPDTGLAWAGEGHVAVVHWDEETVELVSYDGVSRPLRIGEGSPAPPDAAVMSPFLGKDPDTYWIDVGSATAHPIPEPAEAAETRYDSMWRDANDLTWFGSTDGDNIIGRSTDGGATWTTHRLGRGFVIPTYSAAEGVMAAFEYEDANRPKLRLLRVHYSLDGGSTWNTTPDAASPVARIEDRGGMVRADGRLLMHAPGDGGLLVMDDEWSSFSPVTSMPGPGRFEFLNRQGWGDGLVVTGRLHSGSEVYVSSSPGDSWELLEAR